MPETAETCREGRLVDSHICASAVSTWNPNWMDEQLKWGSVPNAVCHQIEH